MTTYHNGLEVPRVQVDYFLNCTLNASGYAEVMLTHTPKGIEYIAVNIVGSRYTRVAAAWILVGKTLTIKVGDLIGVAAGDHIKVALAPDAPTGYDFVVTYQVM